MSRGWRDLLRLRRLISRRLLLARLSLAVERVTSALWAPIALIGGFTVVILFDVLPMLPAVIHGLVLIAVFSGLVWLLRRGFKGFAWPTALEARHRLETTSGVDHRPLTAWEDNLGYRASPVQNTLWMAHRLRMQRLIERLSPPWPSAVIAARDPFGLRAVLATLLLIGVIGAWGDLGPRFVRAVNPALASESGPIDVKVWLTPPAYTKKPPVLLDPHAAQPPSEKIDTPANTEVLAVVTGTARATRIVVDDVGIDLTVMDDASLRYEGPLPAGHQLQVRQPGRLLGSWALNPIPDAPPIITMTDPPGVTNRYRTRFNYSAEDDYGVINVKGRIERPEETRPYAKAWASDISLSIPPLAPEAIDHQSYHDLTAHPWAGETVTITLTAEDAAGQKGQSTGVQFKLPERVFSHPVAATIIRYRKDLIDDPATGRFAARALSRLIEVPEAYGGDVIAHLSMASAQSRLELHKPVDVLDSVIELMWRAALRIEDGTFAVAEQALNDAEQALNDALERDASPEEISRLISRLQRALMDYFQSLAEKMPDGAFPMAESNQSLQSMGSEDLAQMMEQLRQLNELGADDAAKEMMSNLRNMLDMLRNAAINPMDNPEMQAARDMMDELKDITEQQSDMLNRTFEQARQQALQRTEDQQRRRGRRNDPWQERESQPQQSDGGSEEQQDQASAEQSELRQRLGELMGRMAEMTGEMSEDLGDAEQAMQDAEDALSEGAWRSASDSQAEALANLQNGMQQSAQQLMQALAQQGLAGLIPMPGQAGQPFGALGPNLGPDQGDDVELPQQPDTRGMSQRSRAILEEIRRRAGQRLRSQEERQYLRRLLEQF